MRYDDGFVAYLNGVKIAERNAPALPGWNSAATGGDRDDGAAVNFEEIDVTAFKSALVNGNNVLAIHGLTSVANDPDFLLQPQLIADRVVVLSLGRKVFDASATEAQASREVIERAYLGLPI